MENLGWAVSYSDLLMVLMSFFVIFYSADKGEADSILAALTVKMKAKGVVEDSQTKDDVRGDPTGVWDKKGSGVGNKGQSKGKSGVGVKVGDEQTDEQIYSSFATRLLESMGSSGAGVTVETYRDFVMVMLSDDIFDNRKYDLTEAAKLELDEVFAVIKDINRDVAITFVGHSDPSRIKSGTGLLTDNFVLSSLRASRALRYAAEKGISEESLFIEGSAANVRATRSLSVRVELR